MNEGEGVAVEGQTGLLWWYHMYWRGLWWDVLPNRKNCLLLFRDGYKINDQITAKLESVFLDSWGVSMHVCEI